MSTTIGTMDQAESAELLPGQHLLQVMDSTGDTKHIWDADNPEEVGAIKKLFTELKAKGFSFFHVKREGGEKGEAMRDFDPSAERMIAVPRLVGG